MRELPRHLVLTTTWALARLLRRQDPQVGTFAMENNDLASLLAGRRHLPALAVSFGGMVLGTYIRLTHSKIVFASVGSAATYQALPLVGLVPSRIILDLPVQAHIAHPAPAVGAIGHAVFVGILEERKGIATLLEAWSQVEQAYPHARLTVAGSGPALNIVTRWAAERPSSRVALGGIPHEEVGGILQSATTLVLPSERDGRWREQIGLPIQEGLAMGLTVVTTTETGLTPWLAEEGHYTVEPGSPDALAEALVAALERPLPRESVRASLPRTWARLDAGQWLSGAPRNEP